MSVKYQVVIKDFADTTTFGPGNPVAVLSNATHVGWSEYVNEVSEAFFTLSQEDPMVLLLNDALILGKHCHIYRDGELVWGGWLGQSDETLTDVIFTAHSYISGFYHYIMPWDQQWTAWNAHSIIDDAFLYAKAITKSRVGWITRGSMDTLWVESGGPTTLALPLYKASYKRVLSVFREISSYAISDTTNKVKFEVTPAGVFNLLRNDSTLLNDARWSYGSGRIRSFSRVRMPVDRRTEIDAVGSSPVDTTLRATINNGASQVNLKNAGGVKQEPIYLAWVRDATELDRVARIRANKALRVDSEFYVSLFRDSMIPARATSADYAIGDEFSPTINRGITALTNSGSDRKIIVGHQVIFSGGSEYVRLLLADSLGL